MLESMKNEIKELLHKFFCSQQMITDLDGEKEWKEMEEKHGDNMIPFMLDRLKEVTQLQLDYEDSRKKLRSISSQYAAHCMADGKAILSIVVD